MRGDRRDEHGLGDGETAAGGGEYWSLAIDAPHAAAAAVPARLEALGFPAFEEQDLPQGTRFIVYADATAQLLRAEQVLAQSAGLECRIAPLDSSWRLAWTEHLEPVQLTPRLTLVPRPPAGQLREGELYLEPALAFGFGEHASTRLIAGWLEQLCRRLPGLSVLDIGSGTGVLALVAAQSGAGRIMAVDTSLDAACAARRNLELNQITGVDVVHGSLEAVPPGTFDCVVANIEANVLASLSRGIAERLAPGARVALAGLLGEQSPTLIESYGAVGVELHLAGSEGEWALLASPGSGVGG